MGFDASKYNVISERNLGQVNGWDGDTVVIKYQYGSNPVSIKVVTRGTTKAGKEYENKLITGMPLETLADLIDVIKEEM